MFFHRRLRCLLIIDLKIGELVHADIGQMHLYTNFAREHWMQPGENPPVGLILCTGKNDALAHYAMEGLGCKMLVREYQTALPKESALAAEVGRTRELLEQQAESAPDVRAGDKTPASVCGRRAGKVERRRRDGGNGAGAQRRRRAADGSPPLMRPDTIAARDERAVLRRGTGVVERDTGRRAARGAQQTARWSRRADRFD